MRINHRRVKALVSEQLLDRPYVIVRLQHIRREGMSERVARQGLALRGATSATNRQVGPPPPATRSKSGQWIVVTRSICSESPRTNPSLHILC